MSLEDANAKETASLEANSASNGRGMSPISPAIPIERTNGDHDADKVILEVDESLHKDDIGPEKQDNRPDDGVLDVKLPDELNFLTLPECNPAKHAKHKKHKNHNKKHDENEKQHSNEKGEKEPLNHQLPNHQDEDHNDEEERLHLDHLTSDYQKHHMQEEETELSIEQHEPCHACRTLLGKLVYSFPIQGIVLIVIIVDVAVTVADLASVDMPDELISAIELTVIIVLSSEVLARLFYLQHAFFKQSLNVFELMLVPITMIEVFALSHLNLPVASLRTVRPILRCGRVMRIIIRSLAKNKMYQAMLRAQLSGDRKRFKEDGFDLDLAYVTNQIIAMSDIAIGYDAILHNPLKKIAKFFNSRHGNKYLILNTKEIQDYPIDKLFHRHVHFPIPKDGVPTLDALMTLCRILNGFLSADPEHILAIHSRHGQGRVGLVLSALIIYRSVFTAAEKVSVASVVSYIESQRVQRDRTDMANLQTLDSASQWRFLEYFAHQCNGRAVPHPVPRPIKLHKVKITGIKNVSALTLRVFQHEGNRLLWRKAKDKDKSHHGKDKEAQPLNTVMTLMATGTGQASTQPEEFEDFSKVDDKSKPKSDQTLVEYVQQLLAESLYDSTLAGVAPQVGTPILDSQDQAREPDDHEYHSGDLMKGRLPRVWEFKDNVKELAGEICFEIWQHDEDSKEDSLLFGFWLHSSYLEHDQPPLHGMAHTVDKERVVSVVLHGFDLDKGVNSPPLRNQSRVLKIQLQFEAEHMLDSIVKNKGSKHSPTSPTTEVEKEQQEEEAQINAGVETSDSYDIGWLTWSVERLWPYAEKAVAKMLREWVEPALQTSLPDRLKGIRFSEFTLGKAHPQLGPLVACSRHHEGFEIQLDIWVKYSGDANIVVDAVIASVGIGHIKLNGLLSIKLKPILEEIPIVAGINLFFLNPPEIDLTFSGHLEVANIDMIRKAILKGVAGALQDILVLPNMLVLNWSMESMAAAEPVATFGDVLPHAVVRLRIHEAHDLFASDFHCFRKRTSDPFVKIKLGLQKVQTTTKKQTLNPVWNEDFDLLLHDKKQRIFIEVFDHDVARSDETLGKVGEISVANIIDAGLDGLWIPLVETPGSQRSRVRVSICVCDLSSETADLEGFITATPGLLQVAPTSDFVPAASSGLCASMTSSKCASPDVCGPAIGLQQEGEAHSGSVAILTAKLVIGRIPKELGEPWSTTLQVTLGKASGIIRVNEAIQDMTYVNAQVQTAIERLAKQGWKADKIAQVVQEDVGMVQRVMQNRLGWNAEQPQRACMLIKPSDMMSTKTVELAVLAKGKVVASCEVPIGKILEESETGLNEVFELPVTGKYAQPSPQPSPQHSPSPSEVGAHAGDKKEDSKLVVDLQMEFRFLSILEPKDDFEREKRDYFDKSAARNVPSVPVMSPSGEELTPFPSVLPDASQNAEKGAHKTKASHLEHGFSVSSNDTTFD